MSDADLIIADVMTYPIEKGLSTAVCVEGNLGLCEAIRDAAKKVGSVATFCWLSDHSIDGHSGLCATIDMESADFVVIYWSCGPIPDFLDFLNKPVRIIVVGLQLQTRLRRISFDSGKLVSIKSDYALTPEWIDERIRALEELRDIYTTAIDALSS